MSEKRQQSVPCRVHKLTFLCFVRAESGPGKFFRGSRKGSFRRGTGAEGAGGKAGIDSPRQQVEKVNTGIGEFGAQGVGKGVESVFRRAVRSHVRNWKKTRDG